MEKFIIIFRKIDRSKINFFRLLGMVLMIGISTSMLICRPTQASATERYGSALVIQPDYELQGFDRHMAMILHQNKTWGLVSERLGRSESLMVKDKAVGLKNRVEANNIRSIFNGDLHCDIPVPQFCKGLSYFFLENINAPIEMTRNQNVKIHQNAHFTKISVREEFRVYVVRRKDSLWKIAKQFGMEHQTLAKVNEMSAGEILQVGRPLKVKVLFPRELTLNLTSESIGKDPSLFDQIRLTDGRPVPRWMVKDFAAEVVQNDSPGTENIIGERGIKKSTISVNFRLEKNHLEVQAKKFHPIVLTHAKRHNLDPALIMAIIHTESSFNPNARSRSSAYGLMQLVPHTAGKEAFRKIYGEERNVPPKYLYDPENNIELGTAYLNILSDKYMRSIVDPISRTYCAVAAYHAGPSNVGRAFIPKRSIKLAIPIINSLTPTEVYNQLVKSLPMIESQNYVRMVITRLRKYTYWYSKTKGDQT